LVTSKISLKSFTVFLKVLPFVISRNKSGMKGNLHQKTKTNAVFVQENQIKNVNEPTSPMGGKPKRQTL
jgi:hypothetical protein